MARKIFSIIDIETTGAIRSENKITEIAAIKYDGERVVDKFHSLIHPEKKIPPNISYMTGITDEMLKDAPRFYQIARELYLFLEGSVFVAHNVYFDFNFVQKEFRDLGFAFRMPKMCTVKMSRHFLPGHRSYSLGKLCADLNIAIKDRHRAMGDAMATLELFKKLQHKSTSLDHLATPSQKQLLPAYLEMSDYQRLPEKTGIYKFYDRQGRLLYVGKSKNIKKRVKSHFRLNVNRRKDLSMKNEIHRIRFRVTGHELLALLLENYLIKKYRPLYNSALRRIRFPYAVIKALDKDGFIDLKMRFIYRPSLELQTPLYFSSKKAALAFIEKFYAEEFPPEKNVLNFTQNLPRLKQSLGMKKFNSILNKAFHAYDYPHHNFKLRIQNDELKQTVDLNFSQQRLLEYRLLNQDLDVFKKLKVEEDQDSRKIILNYLRDHDDYRILL